MFSIFPPPRCMRTMPGHFIWPQEMKVFLPSSFKQSYEFKNLKNVFSQKVREVNYRFTQNAGQLTLTTSDSFCESVDPVKQQGYFLRITTAGLLLTATDCNGFRYGLGTLRKLLENTRDAVKCVKINDSPEFTFRGFGAFLGGHDTDKNAIAPKNLKRDLKFYENLIQKCSINRYTHFVFEPQIFRSDNQLYLTGNACRKNGLNPLPVFPYLGMRNRGNILKYATASRVEFKDIIRPLAETIKLLKPETVCIGGDELVSQYEYSQRKSLYSPKRGDAPSILAKAILRFYDFLSSQGIRLAIWADALIDERRFSGFPAAVYGFGGKGDEHWKIAGMLPKDIMLWDWQYVPQIQYPTLDYLQHKGFEVIGCPKSPWGNIELFSEYAAGKTNGMLCADWWEPLDKGMEFPSALMESPSSVFRAGNAFWSPGKYADSVKKEYCVSGERVDLSVVNRRLNKFRRFISKDIWSDDKRRGGGSVSLSAGFSNKGWTLLGRSSGLRSGLILADGLGAKPGRSLEVEFYIPFVGNAKFALVDLRFSSMFCGKIFISHEKGRYQKLQDISCNVRFKVQRNKQRFFRIKILGKNVSFRKETLLRDVRVTFGVK